MESSDCASFLQWALPQIGLRWKGFRRVRGQVCKRIARRLTELDLTDLSAYRRLLQPGAAEWQELSALCTVSISRFYRDKDVFDCLGSTVLPALAEQARSRGGDQIRCWSAGCASGEESYTLAIQWGMLLAQRFPGVDLRVLGTDVDSTVLERARAGCYKASSVEALPAAWRDQAFERREKLFCLREAWRRRARFEHQDLLSALPAGPFDLVLCRNVALTYFAEDQARIAIGRIAKRLRPGGALVIGVHETLPAAMPEFEPWPGCRAVFRRSPPPH